MLPQGEGIILLDSGQGDGDGTLLSLKQSLDESDRTEQRWQQQGLWNSIVTLPSLFLWPVSLVENCSAWYAVTLDLITTKKNLSNEKTQEREQKPTHAP